MDDYLTLILAGLVAAVLLLRLTTVSVRLSRTLRERRRAALAAAPRRALLAFVAGGGDGVDDLVAMPAAPWRAVEPTAVALLGKVRGEAHAALAGVFERRGLVDAARRNLRRTGRVRRARAAELLGNLRLRAAVPDLCALLADPHPELRLVAARALGRIADPAAARPLVASLAPATAPHRPAVPSQLVAHALIQIGPSAAPAAVAALHHPEPLVRVTALDALGMLGAPRSAGPVADALAGDPAPEVRITAAATLGRLGTRSALDPLVAAAAADQPAPLRAAAARARGDLGAAAAVAPLRRLLAEPEYRVAHEAAHALRRLGTPGLAELDRVAAGADGDAAAHAREALALAAVTGRTPGPGGPPAPTLTAGDRESAATRGGQ